ncbi:hypothetical protein CSUI_001356 [Cystoisospora suis]|uniref:Uncharacterized protein n=1 Tax=Cystoisospora suis TaxID=483139 RepID=A0A2C6LDA0_9APIC|nr:hypothetical protein CSUI_001356 [Cystoisospora suis]
MPDDPALGSSRNLGNDRKEPAAASVLVAERGTSAAAGSGPAATVRRGRPRKDSHGSAGARGDPVATLPRPRGRPRKGRRASTEGRGRPVPALPRSRGRPVKDSHASTAATRAPAAALRRSQRLRRKARSGSTSTIRRSPRLGRRPAARWGSQPTEGGSGGAAGSLPSLKPPAWRLPHAASTRPRPRRKSRTEGEERASAPVLITQPGTSAASGGVSEAAIRRSPRLGRRPPARWGSQPTEGGGAERLPSTSTRSPRRPRLPASGLPKPGVASSAALVSLRTSTGGRSKRNVSRGPVVRRHSAPGSACKSASTAVSRSVGGGQSCIVPGRSVGSEHSWRHTSRRDCSVDIAAGAIIPVQSSQELPRV